MAPHATDELCRHGIPRKLERGFCAGCAADAALAAGYRDPDETPDVTCDWCGTVIDEPVEIRAADYEFCSEECQQKHDYWLDREVDKQVAEYERRTTCGR